MGCVSYLPIIIIIIIIDGRSSSTPRTSPQRTGSRKVVNKNSRSGCEDVGKNVVDVAVMFEHRKI